MRDVLHRCEVLRLLPPAPLLSGGWGAMAPGSPGFGSLGNMNWVGMPWGREGRERSPSVVMNSVTDTEETLLPTSSWCWAIMGMGSDLTSTWLPRGSLVTSWFLRMEACWGWVLPPAPREYFAFLGLEITMYCCSGDRGAGAGAWGRRGGAGGRGAASGR